MNLNYITRKDLRENPDKVFLFGDNLCHVGMGGQAAEMRGEPNAVGIPTKVFPHMEENAFFNDKDFAFVKKVIDEAFDEIPEGMTVIVPAQGIGTGFAQLNVRAPKIFAYIQLKVAKVIEQGIKYTRREALLCDNCRGEVVGVGDGDHFCKGCKKFVTATIGVIREEVK